MALSVQAKAFYRHYQGNLPELKDAAAQLELFIAEVLRYSNLDLHIITARAKSAHSVLSKIRRKKYGAPRRQLTDEIGVRVVTYYENDVDRVAELLRDRLNVDERRSVDKRTQLDIQEFGYRSVHLISRLRDSDAKQPTYSLLKDQLFEVQIRSILEHAWAEIEHEINYKAGIKFAEPFRRTFGAIAGSLEILEAQFLALKRERNLLIGQYKIAYDKGLDVDEELDAARLLALLEVLRPNGLSWRTAEENGRQFPPRIEATCVSALAAVGIRTANQLKSVVRTPRFRGAVKRFANNIGLDPAESSHFALSVIAVGITNPQALLEEYPELVEDIALRKLFQQ
ncbi:MAG: GTP pyrophosphokinase [Pyrinomonadaceae bacterium]